MNTEQSILGAALLNNIAFAEASLLVDVDDFQLDSNRRIWRAMNDLTNSGKPIEAVLLMHELGPDLASIGGAAYLSTLTEGVVSNSNVLEAQCHLLRSQSKRRRMVHACIAAVQSADDQTQPTEAILGDLEQSLLSIRANKDTGLVHIKDIMPSVLSDIEKAWEFSGEIYGSPTGINAVDLSTGGIREKETWVIGAKTSRGKTALAGQIAMASAARREPVVLFALEMSQVATVKRFLVQHGLCDASRMKDPKWMSAQTRSDMLVYASEVAGMPIYIDDTPSQHVRTIIARSRLARMRYGVKLVIVDYLQLVKSTGSDERLKITAAIQALRDMAKAESLKLVVLSQLRRTQNENDWPTLDHLQESGAIEQSADVVLFLHRPKNEGGFTGEDHVVIAKQRNGPTGPEKAVYLSNKFMFADRA